MSLSIYLCYLRLEPPSTTSCVYQRTRFRPFSATRTDFRAISTVFVTNPPHFVPFSTIFVTWNSFSSFVSHNRLLVRVFELHQTFGRVHSYTHPFSSIIEHYHLFLNHFLPFSTSTTMPAASAEKRARQHANKASRQETVPTKLQRPQSTGSKAPECPTSPVTPHPPVSDDIMHPASIERLIGLAKDSPPNSPLGIVWRHAFEEGKGIGYSEGTRLVNGLEVNEITRIGVERGIERGIEIGRDRDSLGRGVYGMQQATAIPASPLLDHLEALLFKLKTLCLVLSQLPLFKLKP